MQDNGKLIAILSYCTLVGFIIALVLHFQEDKNQRSPLGVFHIRQALGLLCTAVAMAFSIAILMFIPIIGWFLAGCISLCYFGLVVLIIIGIINAANSEQKPLPLVGKLYQKLFADFQ